MHFVVFLGNDCIHLSSWCFESLDTQQARINILFDSIVEGHTFQAIKNAVVNIGEMDRM